MIGTWHNNLISEKLNKHFKHDFSICDIDGAIRVHYNINGYTKTRFIIYESKNANERIMGKSQLNTLRLLKDSIDWSKFDSYSGVYVLKIIDIDNIIKWYDLDYKLIRTTNFEDLYKIFSAKII